MGQDSGWKCGRLGNYVADDCYGSSEKTHDDISGTPVLRMGNIQNGRLDLRDLKYLHIAEKDRAKLVLKRGDIVVNRTNSAELDALQAEVDALKRLHAETATELDGLLPAISDRAFKGYHDALTQEKKS